MQITSVSSLFYYPQLSALLELTFHCGCRKVGEVGGCVKVGKNIQLTAQDGKKQHSHQAEILEQEQMGVTNALIKWYIIVC
ncbi:hypothetical protein CsatB_023167 [Cannabis sativa]